MVRNIGRLLLLVVGGLMIWSGLTNFIPVVNEINSIGWGSFFSGLFNGTEGYKDKFVTFLQNLFVLLAALSAILSAIFNRSGFWFFVFTAILTVFLVMEIISKNNAGGFAQDKLKDTILDLFKNFGVTIGYVLGFILLKFPEKSKK